MRLKMDGVWNISSNHLKILESAESFIKTHNFVPESMLKNKSNIKANFKEYLTDLIKLKFITNAGNDFKLSLSGYDCLAINSLRKKGLVMMGTKIGIGKESDIYNGVFETVENGINKRHEVVLKVHRLGRTSFNKIENRNLKNDDNWFLANKESARNEAEFLKLFSSAFPEIPKYFACNRHILVLEYLEHETLYNVKVEDEDAKSISESLFDFLKRFYDFGYVHGDFNEFNIMINENDIKILDFPQCLPVTDERASSYLKRDVECIHKFFWKKNFIVCDDSVLQEIYLKNNIKIEVERNGFSLHHKNAE